MNALIFVFTTFSLFQAEAVSRFEVTCKNQNCLTSGWSGQAVNQNYSTETICDGDDCAYFGWKTTDSQNNTSETICEVGGCFVTGSTTTYKSAQGRQFMERVECNEKDCLTNGWEVMRDDGNSYPVSCLNGDCSHEGWEVSTMGHYSRATCRLRDCFRFGWIIEGY